MMIRRLGSDDAKAFRAIRLEALRDNPDAYGSTLEDWQSAPLESFAERLRAGYVFGAFLHDALVAITAYDREKGGNLRHRGWVTAVYVQPAARGSGMAGRLLAAVTEKARADGVSQLELHVATDNLPALRTYRKAGFAEYGTVPRALFSRGRFIDEVHMALALDS